MYVVHIMNQIYHFFNVSKKSNLLIIMAGESIMIWIKKMSDAWTHSARNSEEARKWGGAVIFPIMQSLLLLISINCNKNEFWVYSILWDLASWTRLIQHGLISLQLENWKTHIWVEIDCRWRCIEEDEQHLREIIDYVCCLEGAFNLGLSILIKWLIIILTILI
jgi:hypothetical protein